MYVLEGSARDFCVCMCVCVCMRACVRVHLYMRVG